MASSTSGSPVSVPRRSRSCLGRAVAAIAILVILVLVVVGLLPTLLGTSAGRRFVERMAAPAIDGTLTIDRLALSWTGAQQVEGLTIVDRSGRKAVDLDIGVQNGLLNLALGGWKRISVTLGGAIDVELRPDGTNSLADLAPKAPPSRSSTKPAAPRRSSGSEPLLPPGLDATLVITELDITLTERSTGRVAKLEKLGGEVIAGTVRPLSIRLGGSSLYEGRSGTLAVTALATNLIRPDGSLGFEGASVDGSVKLAGIALPLPDMLVEIRSFDATIASAALTETIALAAQGEATLNASTPSALVADITASRLIRPDGSIAFSTDALVAEVRASNLPVAAIEPLLGALPIVPSRDLGPTANAAISYPGGGGAITLSLVTENVTFEGTGTVDAATQSIDMSRLALDARVLPALLESAAALSAPGPIPLRAEFTRLAVPGGRIEDASIAGALTIPERVEIARLLPATEKEPAGREPLGTIEGFRLALDAPRLRDSVHVVGGGMLEGGTLAIDQRITGLAKPDGSIDIAGATIVGTLSLTEVPTQRLMGVLPPETAALAREVVAAPLSLRVSNSGSTAREATVAVSSGALAIDASGTLAGETLSIAALTARVPVTPGLVAKLQESKPEEAGQAARASSAAGSSTQGVLLRSPTTLTAAVQPFTIALDALDRVMTAGPPITAQLALAPATLGNVPGIVTDATIQDFKGDLAITPGPALGARFDGGMKLLAAGSALANVAARVDAKIPQEAAEKAGGSTDLAATIDVTALDVATAEKALGNEPGSLVGLLGRTGRVELAARPREGGVNELTIRPAFESLDGVVEIRQSENLIAVEKGTLQVRLSPDQVDMLLRPSTPSGEKPLATVAGPLRLDAKLEGLSFDPRLLGDDGDPSDPARTKGRLVATLVAPTMKLASGQSVEFQPIAMLVESPRIDQGVTLKIDGTGVADGRAALIAVQGAVRNLVDARAKLDAGRAVLDLDARITDIPTIVIDRLQSLDGLLVTALGEILSGTLKTQGLSKTSGTLTASLSSPNGRVDIPQATLRDEAIVIERARPISGEFQITKALRERLLRQINPVLADIRQTQQPIRLAIPDFVLPLDDNRARLDGDIQLTFGEVEFDAGSPILRFLDIFSKRIAPTIPGVVEPLNVAIRKGQLTYRDFAIRVNRESGGWKHSLVFSGDVDLAANPPFVRAIKSMYPVEGLAQSVEELQRIPLVGALSVGITFFGPLYDAAGEPRQLDHRIDVELPKPEDVLKDPKVQEKLQDALGDIFRRIDRR
ncbi:MAG TPA: hypothetical protein PKC43_08190 [Phycisphaerales bacterium]|nr:hypothetical protein [Phycisphaerales bacterium]HMP37416.1 hypothetical protein [Phycisphaerales bacterium]